MASGIYSITHITRLTLRAAAFAFGLGLSLPAFAADAAYTVTSSGTIVVPAGYHGFIAVDNEAADGTEIACSFIGTPAAHTAGSWTIGAGITRVWMYPPSIPGAALLCISAGGNEPVTVESD